MAHLNSENFDLLASQLAHLLSSDFAIMFEKLGSDLTK